jgi:hypothetical protein
MFSIPNGIFNKYYEVVDALYENENIADRTSLVTTTKQACPNCIPGSTSVYKSGGPIPFDFGPCPYCGGSNEIVSTNEEIIYLRTYPNKRNWIKIGNVQVPDGAVQIIGKMTDLKKVKQADYMVFFSLSDWKYELDSDPFPFGFGTKEFVAYCIKK